MASADRNVWPGFCITDDRPTVVHSREPEVPLRRRLLHRIDGLQCWRLLRPWVVHALAAPRVSSPIMFGAPAPAGDLLPWSWAEQRLVNAQNYWIATTRPGGRPHCRPIWGVWLPDGFWFSTGSLAARNLPLNDEITVHLETAKRS